MKTALVTLIEYYLGRGTAASWSDHRLLRSTIAKETRGSEFRQVLAGSFANVLAVPILSCRNSFEAWAFRKTCLDRAIEKCAWIFDRMRPTRRQYVQSRLP